MNGQTPEIPIEHLLRELAPQVLGVVARRFRDFSSAEDAVQEAMLAAFRQWPQAAGGHSRESARVAD
jgi:predicted RNA polymerase sigma factor